MVRRRLSAGWCQRAVIDGGAASGADPHFLFGCGPIVKTKVAPCLMSSWLNHGLFHGLPLSVADWMYALAGELFFATIRSFRSEEHTSELQSLMRISYAVFCLKKKTQNYDNLKAYNDVR